ncbi:unnamed protein product [Leptosia nina]|uniref:Uncharacterized protein n=1 Tax=Leptosia nina TaxID=320188 RepID=A0AAV1JLF8_9NEOP
MSVRRSPPATFGSMPDLPNAGSGKPEQQITLRKRKQPDRSCCCNQELQDFRRDITTLLDNFNSAQETTLKFMRDNLMEIKTQLNDIKGSVNGQLTILRAIEESTSPEDAVHT